jgi:hypothetical protein
VKLEAYPAARTVSPLLHAYFNGRLQQAGAGAGSPIASVPCALTIEALIDSAFWASLRREEGYVPKISLAFLTPEETAHPWLLERPLRLVSASLTRVAPAVERPGVHLGVSREGDGWVVWGTTRTLPPLCFVVEVAAPGLLVVKHSSLGEAGKFINVAVLEGDQVKLIDDGASNSPNCPALLSSLLGFASISNSVHGVNILVRLAISMRAHGRGGCLLVVPAAGETWRESLVHPLAYSVSPPFAELAQLSREIPDDERRTGWQEDLVDTIDWIAGLTAVDGAALITDRYELLGFGAKIARRRGWEPVEKVTVTEPVKGALATVVHPEELGGTRHLSAAQFVHDQRDAMALVASQDGRFTIFEWSACEATVHAHKVEALLL